MGSNSIGMSHLATMYYLVPVAATQAGVAHNPTGDAVQFAFMPQATQVPQNTDWVSGSWDTDTSNILYPYSAKCLVGPSGTISLGIGTYVVWVKITDNPEIPVLICGQLTISLNLIMCSVDGCDRTVYCKKLCKTCYSRVRYRVANGIPADQPVRGNGQFCPRGHDRALPNALNRRGECRECERAVKREAYTSDPRVYKDRMLRRNYGIGLDSYERLLKMQDGKCAICGDIEDGRALAVDHDHVTGKVRGLLCANCNNGLGRFKDDAERLKAAVRYLEGCNDPHRACDEAGLEQRDVLIAGQLQIS